MREAGHKRSHIVGFHFCQLSRKGKSIEVKSRLVVIRAWLQWGGNGEGLITGMGFPLGVIIYLGTTERLAEQHCECTKCLWSIPFKKVTFTTIAYQYFLKITSAYWLRLLQIDWELTSTSAKMHPLGKFFDLHTGAQNRGNLNTALNF